MSETLRSYINRSEFPPGHPESRSPCWLALGVTVGGLSQLTTIVNQRGLHSECSSHLYQALTWIRLFLFVRLYFKLLCACDYFPCTSVCARMSLVSMDAGESIKFPGVTDGMSQRVDAGNWTCDLSLTLWVGLFCIETRSHVAQAGLQLTL